VSGMRNKWAMSQPTTWAGYIAGDILIKQK
jgi:hypothetical protein